MKSSVTSVFAMAIGNAEITEVVTEIFGCFLSFWTLSPAATSSTIEEGQCLNILCINIFVAFILPFSVVLVSVSSLLCL